MNILHHRLTTPQQNIYNETKFYSDTALGNIGGTLEFSMEGLNSENIEKAINLLIDAAEGLRLRITEAGGEVCQYVCNHEYESIPVIDATELTQEQIDEHVSALMKTPITYDGKLYRFEILKTADSWLIVAVMHHIVSDAWSMTIIDDSILHACEALIKGEEPVLNIAPYTDVVAKEQEYFASKKYQKDKAFWLEMYSEHPEYVRLKPNAMTSTSPSANRLYAEVSPALSKQIKAFCTEHEYSPATVFEAAMLIYLDRINGGGKTPSLGLAVLNRDGAKDKRTLGMFISTIPLTAKPSEDKTLGELCAEINDLHLQIFRHQKYPYSHILSDIHQHHGDVEKLFDVTVSYQTAQADKSAMAQSHWYGNGYCENTLNFHVDDRDNSGLFHINIDYQVQQFDDQAEVGLLKDRILYIIEQIVSNSAKTIGQTGIISPIEYDLITNIFNQTSQPLPHKSVIDLFGEQVKNAPDQIALVCQGKGVTYSELDKQSNQIANFLIEKDITKGDIVAVSLPRVNISIACILGILKVGAAYLLIDPANPQERIEYILTNSLAKLYITEASLEKCMSHNDSKPIIDVTENDLCYCIYTSGTTGNPKGVAISHHNLLSYIESCKGIYGSDHVNMPYFTAPFVDLTVTSIYLPLLTGGTIYLYPEEVYHSIPQIIENSDLSVIKLTPTHLQLFNQCGNCKELPHISHLILGGENLLAKDCFEFLSRYGAHIKIHNEYGPTETTVGCTDYVYSPNDHALSVPIGHPTANIQLYILDSSMRITPVGIQGELCVAGDGVGMGYLNNPDLTKIFFIPNPFGKGVIYKTGDIAYWGSDGNIVYVGRRDDQVKIHGVRIELGEIEASVLEYPNILQASAVVLNSENNPQVCVYYTASDAVNSNDIRNHIAHRLPRQMLPALFMQIDSMPIASGGKVNKKALPIPDFSKSKPMTEYSAPQTELEKQVSNIIEQLLNISRVSIDDDLFDCGLNSLKVIEFIITLQKEGISLNAQDVYNHPSVRSLSTFVEINSTQTIVENSNRSNLQDIMKASIQIKSKSENVLLTGATGFLGIHVLEELYRTTDKTIYCLIRDPQKFESAIVYYTDIPYPNERIICFCGDITEASLGLKSNEYELLCNDIGDIIHCAATVSLFGAWETSKKINYEGTCNVIALAQKASAKLHHVSTISVSGDLIVNQDNPQCTFSEDDLFIGQSYTENVYVHSKYLAEEAVISAIKNSRINASIYRIGHILWDSQTGLFQKNYQSNDIYMLADAFRTLGKIPNELSERRMPIIPVNECAKIICHELDVKENRIYHLYDDSMTWREFMASFGVTETVSFSAFLKESHGHTLQTLKFAEMFLSAIIASNGRFEVNVINEKTRKYLQKRGYLWQNIDRKYVIVYYSKESRKSPTMQSYSLTTPQQNIYNETKFYSDTALGNIGGTLEFSMEGLNSENIEKAINLLIDAAEGLRLRITEAGGEVCQYVCNHEYESIPVIDATELTQEQIDEHVSALMRTPITYDGRLYRFEILKKADSWLIVAVMHHIVSDAWSMTIIDDAILHACEALVKGEEPVLNIAPYTDFVAKEQEYFASKKYQKDKAFWSDMYAEHPEYVRLKPNAMTSTSPSANRLYAEVSPALSAQIKAFCTEHEYSPATVFEAAMLIYLDRINGGSKTPSLGLAVLNRDGAKDKRTLGMFISTIPLTAKPSEDKTLGELCAEINDLHLQIFRHQKYPYSHILSDIHQHHGDVEKLFDVMMSYQNAQIDAKSDVRSKWYTNGNSEVALAFHIDDRDHLGVYKLNLDYQAEQFSDEAEVALLKDRILCVVEQIIAKSDMTVADVDILPESEKELIIHTFNDTAVDYPSDKCVHQLFEEVAANIPNEPAAVFEGASYTYAEINRMANCIAHALRRGGIGRNDIVPIIAHRSHLVLAAQLGVLKAGGAYLPIDPTFPAERITYMLDDASCKAALILEADAPTNVDFVINLADEALYDDTPENLDNINMSNDLCYVIYTSGSTGKPKGTMLMHGNVVNFCSNNEHNIITHCITEERKRIVSTTTIGFDIYVTESLLSLLNGLTVYYANDDESKMQSKLAKLITENEIEIIQTTPTKMKMYMQDKSDLAWLSRLKVIILGGEVFPESLYEELRHYTDARIWNIYGPTETTVWSSVDKVTSPVITIGNPIANTQILICNEKGALCPVGIAGELCIAGDGVCRGYLNREELTAEKFIDNPYVPGKLYKTGDLASYRTDGKLLCYGRIDSQVKIRGLRVELGEIESVMNGFEGIVLSATTVKTQVEHQYLVGYYVAEGDIDEKKLREHILAQLPKYMCPHYFLRLEKIAFTPNGKIDRKNLPNVDFESRESHNEITLPETPMQKEVYAVLGDFIKGTAFGIDEDFFDLGMDSLMTINLTITLSKSFNIDFSVNDIYTHSSVQKLAQYINEKTSSNIITSFPYQKPSQYCICQNVNDIQEFSIEIKRNGNVFLTGTTGFLGIYVLKELYETTDKKIYCLIRDTQKFESVLAHYTCIPYPNNRIICLHGDITETNLGLSDSEYELLCNNISDVIHCAATVSLFGAWETSKKINYSGTCNVITLAEKASAMLHHISTISVSGDMIVPQEKPHCEFSENDLYIGQSYTENVYVHSKYLAEEAVISAIRNATINASIYRIGHVLWDSHTGLFQINYQSNDVYMLMDAFRTIGKLPAEFVTHKMPIIPVNECARIICHELNADENRVYHLYDDSITWGEFMAALGVSEHVSFAEFIAEAQKHKTQTVKFAELFLSAIVSSNGQCNVNVVNAETKNYLNRHNCSWYNMDSNYVMLFKDN